MYLGYGWISPTLKLLHFSDGLIAEGCASISGYRKIQLQSCPHKRE